MLESASHQIQEELSFCGSETGRDLKLEMKKERACMTVHVCVCAPPCVLTVCLVGFGPALTDVPSFLSAGMN